ncbi:hypothetical protein OsJ_23410 [Oryza sativa Japonica Group]|uniref:ATPase AAA-type core domain-containing protein n=1 Tax=Oryza sativa subsp. japonica TaxID=39947 RepID=A3BHF2_ORYSJ|nr:hypothetical protein OsJ_23410 [Oryza sativa Japonica Group]
MEASQAASAWSSVNSGIVLSLAAVLWTVVWNSLQSLQLHHLVGRHLARHARRLAAVVDPYLTVTVAEHDGGRMKRSDAYREVQAYLHRATCDASAGVRHLRAEPAKNPDAFVLSMADREEVADVFRGGVTVWWLAYSTPPREDDAGGGRKNKKKKDAAAAKNDTDGDKKESPPSEEEEKDKEGSKVTLSGVLNFIDGLWSACGGERIIVFTTNHVEKLDPALIRRGRMDKHIEMSYCGFEAFKFLAKVYLGIDAHHLFDAVRALLRDVDMTPADVAENLTPKAAGDNADTCLAELVKELEKAKADKAQAKGKAAATAAAEEEVDGDDDEE